MAYKVVVPDVVHPKAMEILAAAGDALNVVSQGQMTRADLLAQVVDADALIIRSASKVDKEVLDAAQKLKLIARAGVGVDNVDIPEATRRGIIIMNTPDGNTVSTAEHTFGLMLSLARHVPEAHISMREGKWDRKSFGGVELRGKTLGIVGFGRIGRAIAKRAVAFEMTVLAYDPYVTPEQGKAAGAEMVTLEDLFSRADFITLHALLTDETRDLIRAESIAKMKPGVRIVNAARGALINEHDLADAIKSGRVAGAALDVYEQEPPQPDNPLIGLPGIIHTPHLAASTEDAQTVVAVEAAQLIVDALLKGVTNNVVNPAAKA
ncbi:MAG: D-glycerate dehydrogenase [Pleurocapsa minor GSE-CHR-MK-17-07R]|jgi:D-3-phosphoglycerate dehydrogenase|nr:D-glycerate dehydrogenase [Pleurocapsa minor GSE-CHR-MK 17-07R]